ncbi:aldo/keto reductase [Ancylobacter sp. Lp-2]|uniref:aldo/keto reductase n=1 Tax=Ancylobacter sp. Lp-2 TaxID=2881339 RepID=UPI001E5DA75E|nr:aldo/keto reductase [Ancylobacter sp. Lp-2]MCB4768636.1 aldo/keto reductase [Ancylobacter sp. Lp-2]
MTYRYLGRSGVKVSPLCLGAMMFGTATDEAVAGEIIASARASGVNFIDTANSYGKGRSEEIVGRHIAGDRDRWVVATKFGSKIGEGPNEGGISRKWIVQAVEASLKRLGTDYIDLIYFHRAIFDSPLEESVRALGDLISAGKIRYYGVSNFRGWRIAEVARLADANGIDRPIASQPLYNLVNRSAEQEELPAARYYGLGVVPYSPLARGVLTGKYAADAPPPAESRAGREDKRIHEVEFRPESLRIAQQVKLQAESKGFNAADLALAWVLNNPVVVSAIAGPRTLEQWQSYARALEYPFSREDEQLIDGLVLAGHPSTHGFTDPSHPVEGRSSRA